MSDADPTSVRPPVDLAIPGLADAVEIGAGGFGVVYRAAEADLSRTVAVKILAANLDEAGRDRFDRERRAMGTLSGHPNIVTVHRGGYTPAGHPYLVMEYLDRGSLTDYLRGVGPVAWHDVAAIGVQLAGALETAHRAGVLHRDIKPGNILLSRLGSAKLCDFGIARLQGAFETRSSTVTASLAHAPPEVVDGRRPDARSDVYSLASTLYELTTGRPPFVQPTDESMVQILSRIHTAPLPPLDETLMPGPLFRAIETAMAKDPDARPPSAQAFGQLLTQAQQQLGLTPTPIPIEDVSAASAAGFFGGPITNQPVTHQPVTGSGPSPTGGTPTVVGGPAVTGGATTGGAGPPVTGGAGPSVTGTSGPDPAPVGAPVATGTVGAATTGGPARDGARRGVPRWLAPAVALAALVVVGGLATWWAAGSGQDTDTTGPDATVTASTTTTASAADATTGLPATGSADAYASFIDLADASDSIQVKVPQEWANDTLTGPGQNGLPYLAAAPKLNNAFFDVLTGPGVSIEVFGTVREPRAVLDEARTTSPVDQCDAPKSRPIVSPYPGRVEAFENCGGKKTVLVHAALVSRDGKLSALVILQAPTEKDFNAFNAIVDSLVLTRNFS